MQRLAQFVQLAYYFSNHILGIQISFRDFRLPTALILILISYFFPPKDNTIVNF